MKPLGSLMIVVLGAIGGYACGDDSSDGEGGFAVGGSPGGGSPGGSSSGGSGGSGGESCQEVDQSCDPNSPTDTGIDKCCGNYVCEVETETLVTRCVDYFGGGGGGGG